MTSTLTRKGQVALPKKFRDYLGLHPGSAVGFSLGTNGEVIIRPTDSGGDERRFDALRGTLGSGKSTDELVALLRGYDEDAHDPGLK